MSNMSLIIEESQNNQDQQDLFPEQEAEQTVDPVIQFLFDNQDWSDFYASLVCAYNKYGRLTEKQYACAKAGYEKALARKQAPSIKADNTPKKAFTISVGQIIEIKPWIANKFKEELNLEFFLRNLEIVEIHSESPKAYYVSVKFVSKVVSCCHVCGRNLEDEVSKAVGIGPSCAKKIGLKRPSVNEAHLFLAEFEALCAEVGIIANICVPKSQIKNRG